MLDSRDHSDIIASQAPHDDLTFEQLACRYNFGRTSDRRRVLVRLLIKEFQKRAHPIRALDIGCGSGLGIAPDTKDAYLRALRERVDELWGIEPNRQIIPSHGLFDNFQHATMETASLPENSIDVAYSSFVMEHVEDPRQFLSAVYRCLKPGGTYLFLTPNGRHYFTRIAKTLRMLRLEELTLRVMVGSSVEAYHYPVRYKCQHPRQIRRYASEISFEEPEFVFLENEGPRTYFRGPLVLLFHLLHLKRQLIKRPESLLEMIVRLTKPSHAA